MGKTNTPQLNEEKRPHERGQKGQRKSQEFNVPGGLSAGGRDASRGLSMGGVDITGAKRGKKQTLTLGTPQREDKTLNIWL